MNWCKHETVPPCYRCEAEIAGHAIRQLQNENLRLRDRLTAVAAEAKKLCYLIACSPSSTPIKGEIESLAHFLGHFPEVINAERAKVAD